MNENEKTIIKAIASRLEEVRRLSGFLFAGTEEEVVAVLLKEGLDIPTLQAFSYMSKALIKLADESSTVQLPGTGELIAETLKNRLAGSPNGSRP